MISYDYAGFDLTTSIVMVEICDGPNMVWSSPLKLVAIVEGEYWCTPSGTPARIRIGNMARFVSACTQRPSFPLASGVYQVPEPEGAGPLVVLNVIISIAVSTVVTSILMRLL